MNLTEEQKKISKLNKKKAWDYFVEIGDIPKDTKCRYVLHHIDPSWRHNDVERYILWLPEDLVVMPNSEHSKLHWKLDYDERCGALKEHPVSEETKRKISERKKGYRHTDEAKKKMSEAKKGKPSNLKGKHLSEETKRKISESGKGKHSFVMSEDSKNRISNSLKGHKVSQETREKIRNSLKQRNGA